MKIKPLTRYLWALPCTIVGITWVLPVLLLGAKARGVSGALEISLPNSDHIISKLYQRPPFIAITFGHVIIGKSTAELARLRTHEHAHVRQYECWGILFFIAYPLSSLLQWARGRHPYWDNHFEIAARAAEKRALATR
ncbi:MAG: hypothetical protein HOP20_06420 [Sulfuriferula sp.]|nr:hypothetical protein [Sulfuriferula sp.]